MINELESDDGYLLKNVMYISGEIPRFELFISEDSFQRLKVGKRNSSSTQIISSAVVLTCRTYIQLNLGKMHKFNQTSGKCT